jgi:hypothetical protein
VKKQDFTPKKHFFFPILGDDSIIYRSIKTQADCIKDIESAVKWKQDWLLMAFHPNKCNILRVTTKKSPQHFYSMLSYGTATLLLIIL